MSRGVLTFIEGATLKKLLKGSDTNNVDIPKIRTPYNIWKGVYDGKPFAAITTGITDSHIIGISVYSLKPDKVEEIGNDILKYTMETEFDTFPEGLDLKFRDTIKAYAQSIGIHKWRRDKFNEARYASLNDLFMLSVILHNT